MIIKLPYAVDYIDIDNPPENLQEVVVTSFEGYMNRELGIVNLNANKLSYIDDVSKLLNGNYEPERKIKEMLGDEVLSSIDCMGRIPTLRELISTQFLCNIHDMGSSPFFFAFQTDRERTTIVEIVRIVMNYEIKKEEQLDWN